MGPKVSVAIGSRPLFAGQQPSHDFFAVDDSVAVVPGADVVNFDLPPSFSSIEIAHRRPQGAPSAFRAERLHCDQQAPLVILEARLKWGTSVSRKSEPFEKNWQTCEPHGTSPRLWKPVAA